MRQLGISIYPGKNNFTMMQDYISLAHQYNFNRIFTCLLSVNQDKDNILNDFKNIIKHAKTLNMQVIADVDPSIFSQLNLNYKDLSFFKELNVDGIRLDHGYTGSEESIMSFNPQDLFIELNMSSGNRYLENILSYCPNKNKIIACHNFYPHRYTGLSYEHFIKTSKQYKKHGIKTAAFVDSKSATVTPWAVSEGLCTLEMHRNMDIEIQAKHLWAIDLIDDVIIANTFASEEELKKLSQLDRYQLTLNCNLVENIPQIEKNIVAQEFHFNRGDTSEYMIRSTQSRVKYKGHTFEVFNPVNIKRGDIIIESSLYGHYAGELQIALKDMPNSGRTNVVGSIINEEIFLLDYIKPWQKFKFKVVE